MDAQAAFTLVSTSIVAVGMVLVRLWVQRQRGTLRPDRELPLVAAVVVYLSVIAALLSSRSLALLGLPAGLAALGFGLLWVSGQQPEAEPGFVRRRNFRLLGFGAAAAGLSGILIGVVTTRDWGLITPTAPPSLGVTFRKGE